VPEELKNYAPQHHQQITLSTIKKRTVVRNYKWAEVYYAKCSLMSSMRQFWSEATSNRTQKNREAKKVVDVLLTMCNLS